MGRFFIFFSLSFAFFLQASTPQVVLLDYAPPQSEQTDALLIRDGVLWVGSIRYLSSDKKGQHFLELYRVGEKTPFQTIPLPHSPQYLYSIAPDKVLIVGMTVHATDTVPMLFQSHYTVITLTQSGPQLQTTSLPADYEGDGEHGMYVKYATADSGALYFGLKGGGNSLVKVDAKGTKTFGPRIVLPQEIVQLKDLFFVHEMDGQDNVVKFNSSMTITERLFTKADGMRIQDIKYMDAIDRLVVSDFSKGVILIDPEGTKPRIQIPVSGSVGRVEQYGHCLALAKRTERKIQFFDLHTPASTSPIDSWEIDSFSGRFERVDGITADSVSGKVFLKSSKACPTCKANPNSVISAYSVETAKLCGVIK